MSDALAPDYTPTAEQFRDLALMGARVAAHAQGRELDDAELGAMFDRMLEHERTTERERIAQHVEKVATLPAGVTLHHEAADEWERHADALKRLAAGIREGKTDA